MFNIGRKRFSRPRYRMRRVPATPKTYSDLEDLKSKTPDEVIFKLKDTLYGFRELLKTKNLEDAKVQLALRLISIACGTNHKETLRNFLMNILSECSYFINNSMLALIIKMETHEVEFDMAETICYVLDFLQALQEIHPHQSWQVISVILPLIAKLSTPEERADIPERLQLLTTKASKINDELTLVYGDKKPVSDAPNDFRKIALFPDAKELSTRRRPFLRENIIEGRYLNVEQYLDTQYRLLREDFVRPLREGIAAYLQRDNQVGNRKNLDIKIYHNVTIKNALVSNDGVLYQVQFDVNQSNLKGIRWDRSRRLIYGNLVCLTPDNFVTLYFGTVGNRETPNLRKGLIDVKFENCDEVLRVRWKTFTMVETEAYFEASRYVLTALQNIEDSTFPLKEHIVEVQKKISPPEYVTSQTVFCLRCLTKDYNSDAIKIEKPENDSCTCAEKQNTLPVTLLSEDTWPSADDLGLDLSQQKAIRLALTNRIAVIQGPPGTGKTYVGLKIMQALLHNQSHWEGPSNESSPIVVVCYTNHALDQFLESVLELTDKIVRVGGRSVSKKLEPYCMGNLKRNYFRNLREDTYMTGHFQDMKREIGRALKVMLQKDQQLKRSGNIILSEADLKTVIDDDQYTSLSTKAPKYLNLNKKDVGKILPYWLGIQLPPHLLNHQFENEEQSWIVESSESKSAKPMKCPEKFGPRKEISSSNYEMKKYSQITILKREKSNSNEEIPNNPTTSIGSNGCNIELQKPEKFNDINSMKGHNNYRQYESYCSSNSLLESKISLNGHLEMKSSLNGHLEIKPSMDGHLEIKPSMNGHLESQPSTNGHLKNKPSMNGHLEMKPSRNGNLENKNFSNGDSSMNNSTDHLRSKKNENENFEYNFGISESTSNLEKLIGQFNGLQVSNNEQLDSKDIDFIVAQRQEDDADKDGVKVISLDPPEAEEFFEKVVCQDGFEVQGGKKQERKIIAKNLKESKLLSELELESLKKKNIWKLKIEDRWRLYKTWHYFYNQHIRKELENERIEYERKLQAFREIKTQQEVMIAQSATVIGLTTTGAAKYRQFVQGLRSKIVIVEEAAEVLEAQIVTSLSKHTQHLILIGDHQQLRPNPVVYDLATQFHLDISLFERLITNGLPYVTLGIQHRMKPCISKLLVPNIYEKLEDHFTVKEYEDIKGMKKSMFFLTHDQLERGDFDSTSKSNLHEAQFIVTLCHYLLLQGYSSSQITILTTYQGQLATLRKFMPEPLAEVKATVVDNYQGEENDIILLSFVRSNENGVIGFLKTANRVCVALSRAKKGLYCIGNFELLARESALWQNIRNDLTEMSCIGPQLELVCQLHQTVNLVSKPEDFARVANGGCNAICNSLLKCGHTCSMKCHPLDQDHKNVTCKKICDKIICDLNHKCTKLCCQPCGDCVVEVPKYMSKCRHQTLVKCFQREEDLICREPCSENSTCGHPCAGICGDPCTTCVIMVQKTIPKCGHVVLLPCHIENIFCSKRCEKQLACGHVCKKKCGETCEPCECSIKIQGPCGHMVEIECQYRDNKEMIKASCKENCTLLLNCSHPCVNKCGSLCLPFCDQPVPVQLPCGHVSQVGCYSVKAINPLQLQTECKEKCKAILDCGHQCSGSCGGCFQGRLHVPCKLKCEKYLVCGHVCQDVCAVSCPPCRRICENKCSHSNCQQMCGFPCVQCDERCERRCIHQACRNDCDTLCMSNPCNKPCNRLLECYHKCMGLCGEKCPSLCRECHPEALVGVSPNAIFYQLDCEHIFELNELAAIIKSQKTTAVSCYYCPICYTIIRRSLFFRDIVKMANNSVEEVKLAIFSTFQVNVDLQMNLRKRIEEFKAKLMTSTVMNGLFFELLGFWRTILMREYAGHTILVTIANNIEILETLLQLDTKLGALFSQNMELEKICRQLNDYKNTLHNTVSKRMSDIYFCGGSQVQEDIFRETDRLQDFYLFLFNFGKMYFSNGMEYKKYFLAVMELLLSPRYDNETKGAITGLKLKLAEMTESVPPDENDQRSEISKLEPLSFAIYDWFLCTNGHLNHIPSSVWSTLFSADCVHCGVNIFSITRNI